MGQRGPLTPDDPSAIGSYELVKRLGSGGMGTVYLARGEDGAKVALKAIRRDFAADPVYRARFHEEVSNARKVASFCTARVLDHGEDDGVLFLVTEYIDGVSLEDHLIEHGALEPSVLHAAAVGVAAALTAIHAAGLVHRDLKPANVMLTLAGPRVIDFGLARSTHVNSRHTNAGMVMGTPGWIAPEQVFEGRTSPAGDVFAWGSLIAYAGLGGHPFGEGDAYVMAARARTAPPDLRGLPAPLDRLVAAAIHPDPARRPAARQLLLELVGAADEPAAQLAATRHLSSMWNPAQVPPLAQNPPVRQAPPFAGPPHSTTGQGPLPRASARQAPPPAPARQAPPAAPAHPGPSAPPASARPGASAPPSSARPGPSAPPSSARPGPSAPPPSARPGPAAPPSSTGRMPSASTTGQGPLPPPGTFPVPPRPVRRGPSGCLITAVLALVALVLLITLLAWLSRGPAVGAASPVQDGKLKFAVTDTTCPKPAKAARARTCRLAVTVTNVGQEARVLYPGQQKLVDEDDGLHVGVRLLDGDGKEITPIRIDAGRSFTGALEFELPKDAKPAGVELHDSGLSRGIRVELD